MSGSTFNQLFDGGVIGAPQNQLAPQPTWADAWQFNAEHAQAELERQRAISSKMGLWDDARGMPTPAGVRDAATQAAMAPIMGTAEPGFSLERIHPRTLRPIAAEPDLSQAGSHAFSIKSPTGDPVGIVDTAWNPDTRGLHILDFQSNEGPKSLGAPTVRQIRDQLLGIYPGTRTITGQRITGAVSADRLSGAGPGRAATQIVRDQ